MKTRYEKVCPTCNIEFMATDKRQMYCGHKCAATKMHSRGEITTLDNVDGKLANSDNPRYSLDEQGQWWYKPIGKKDHSRTRAYIGKCPVCGVQFLMNIFHRVNQACCSRACSNSIIREKIRGKYKGKNSPNWKGGRRIQRRGYVEVYAPEHPTRINSISKTKQYVLEHRLVMEKALGRYLEPYENVHHKNGIRDDNRIENLELWAKFQPPGQRVIDQIAHAKRLLEGYGLSVFGTPKVI